MYSNARSEALKELYKSKVLDRDRPSSLEADFEEVAASCGYFSFSLQDLASEMQNYLIILEELREETEKTNNRSWKWMLFWKKDKPKLDQNSHDPEQESLLQQNAPNVLHTPSKDIPELIMERRGTVWNVPNEETNAARGFYRKILNIARVLERDDGQFSALYLFEPLLTNG